MVHLDVADFSSASVSSPGSAACVRWPGARRARRGGFAWADFFPVKLISRGCETVLRLVVRPRSPAIGRSLVFVDEARGRGALVHPWLSAWDDDAILDGVWPLCSSRRPLSSGEPLSPPRREQQIQSRDAATSSILAVSHCLVPVHAQ